MSLACPSSVRLTTVTSLLAAPLADNFGRRITLRLGAFIFTVGGAIQTFCGGFWTMVLGRVISGFGVGMLSMIVPIYQASLSALRPHALTYSQRSPRRTMFVSSLSCGILANGSVVF